jgi:transposase
VGRVLIEHSVMEQRFEAVMAVVRDGLPVVEVAAKFGVSRQSVHAWIRRYEVGGVTALEDRSHQPFGCPHQMAPAVEAELCELRRQHPGWGPTRLAWVLAKRGVDPAPSRSAVYRALIRQRLIEPSHQRRRKDWVRWERHRPMELWQMDVVGGIWNRRYVSSVQVTMAEAFGVEGRGAFYDSVGAIRDVRGCPPGCVSGRGGWLFSSGSVGRGSGSRKH